MKLEATMGPVCHFQVWQWGAGTPESVLANLQSQLKAAATIWPELERFQIRDAGGYRKAGLAGAAARAAKLPPARRSEIASTAANARWHPKAVP